MLYAKVVLPLPVSGSFDYLVPEDSLRKVRPGCRAEVNFGGKDFTGYVVGLSKKSTVCKLKYLSRVLDEAPLFGREMLCLTRKLAQYYCSSWGEALFSALPEGLRGKKRAAFFHAPASGEKKAQSEITFIHCADKQKRWERYFDYIQEALATGKGIILLLPAAHQAVRTQQAISEKFKVSAVLLVRGKRQQAEGWLLLREGKASLAIGTRSAIFAPLAALGLIIIDEENDAVYKQVQAPHYHARQVAFWRARTEGAKLILGSAAPSLESFYLAQQGKISYSFSVPDYPAPEIKLVDMQTLRSMVKGEVIFSKYLEDSIAANLDASGKTLLFVNRRGFATFMHCRTCGKALVCPRCNLNLVYHFDLRQLSCHRCNFKLPLPKLCPECNSGYIRFSGVGTEKVESELARIFPRARIKRLEGAPFNPQEADIFISTSAIIKQAGFRFDLVGVLLIDHSLQRVDFRAGEKTYALLSNLVALTKKTMLVQTGLGGHHVFAAILANNPELFYRSELKERASAGLPPFKHLGLVKLRGPSKDKVKQSASRIYAYLLANKTRGIGVGACGPAQPEKLRGNYYYQIMLKAGSALGISRFLSRNLKKIPRSGSLLTVDIDPL
jgi:primosomal protein N' (replication factor Y)